MPLRAGTRFCVECGAAHYPAEVATAPAPVVSMSMAPAAPAVPPVLVSSTTTPAPVESRTSYPLLYAVPYPGRQSRLTTFFRVLLAVPHVIVVYVLGIAAWVISVVAWFAILFTGRYPRDLWDFAFRYLRWYVYLITYLALLRDEYPPFGDGPYPVALQLGYPGRQNRLTVFFRLLMALPAAIVLGLVQYAWFVIWVLGWFAILLTGRHPEGLWRFSQGVARWTIRYNAYVLLLTDAYPPFSLGNEETPGVAWGNA